MRKFILVLTLTAAIVLGSVSLVYAQETSTFNVSLGFGSSEKVEVLKLQNFLFNLGYLKVSPTGLFLSLTKKAVADFQVAEGIAPALGYFGPTTRGVANRKVASGIGQSSATISNTSVTDTNRGVASAVLSNSKTVTWQTGNYPTTAGVDINLLRKTSDSPTTFVLIRVLAENTVNDGREMWVPRSGEVSGDVYLEVVCSNTEQFKSGCRPSAQPTKVN